jgi:hypothetical protein
MSRLLLLVCLAATAFAADPNQALFDSRLAPIFTKHCAACHAGSQASGGLSLDSWQSVFQGGKHGASIVPGSPDASLLVQYLKGEKTPRMPLGSSLPSNVIDQVAKAIAEMTPQKTTSDSHFQWLFSKPAKPALPRQAAHPIDAFILSKLDAQRFTPAPPADRRALIRRVYFDLLGVPPTPDEVDTFFHNTSPDAYEKLIDRLLADNRYGERYARHWLDLVRFAESDGFAIDGERPTAWRYRDYVIRSFNSDKPYDQFIREQLAGDELQGAGERSERLVALGYYRMATWEADANFKTQLRQDFLNEITATTSQVFLGLTAGCARCHDHKYDPIPTRDFYRLQAFFAATRIDDRPAPHTKAEDPDRRFKHLVRQMEDEAEAAQEAFQSVEERLKKKAPKDFARLIKDKKDATFTEAERTEYVTARDRARRLSELPARHRPLAYAVSDIVPPHVPAVADTYVLTGGELGNKAAKVEPGFLSCITGNGDNAKIPFAGGSSGRRTALADWIASPNNPMTARVMVNRIWQHHFGRGLVNTPSDFGRNGERPTHAELLDYLAAEFIERKWSIKAMHKLMLLSNTFQQSTAHPHAAKYSAVDPENKLLWRMNWLRLESETLRDSILAVSGQLRSQPGGPGVFLDVADDVAEGFEFFKWFPSPPEKQLARTIYTFQRRSVVNPMMEVFDAANMAESCARRNTTVVPPQAFALLNSKFTHQSAQAFAERVREAVGDDRDRQVDQAFRYALARRPTPSEAAQARRLELPQLALVLFNLNEFLYLE